MKNSLRILLCTLYLVTLLLFVSCTPKADHLTILHTNDTHSQIEPKANDQGGYARRMGLIAEERKADPDLLLLDAGDFCQGTPYFNFYHGRIEIDAMNRMGYDAVTLGNHEFDNGLDTLAVVLQNAHFPVLNANYDFTGTPLEKIVKPVYNHPYPVAQQMADLLRAKHCDVVICLSHLGTYCKPGDGVCDADMARQTRGIDVIIGGHTHKMYDNLRVANLDGDSIPLCQMGKSGVYLGRIMLNLDNKTIK